MRTTVIWLTLVFVCVFGCGFECTGRASPDPELPIASTSTFKAPVLTGNESSAELKKILAETQRSYAAVVSSLAADIKATETSEVQTSLNWLTGFAVLGLLGSLVVMWVVGVNKWDIGLALGMGGCIFVLQGLSAVAAYRYEIGAGMLVLGLIGAGIWLWRGSQWRKVKDTLHKEAARVEEKLKAVKI